MLPKKSIILPSLTLSLIQCLSTKWMSCPPAMTCFFLHYYYGNVIKYFSSARHGAKYFPGFSSFVLLAILFYFYFTDQENKWRKVKRSAPSRVITDKITPPCNDVLSSRNVPGPVLSTGTSTLIRCLQLLGGARLCFTDRGPGALRSKWIPLSSDWPAVMLHICCISTPEADRGGSLIWGQPGLLSETLSQNSNNK